MKGFTFLEDYYEVIKKMKKPQDRQAVTYAIIEFVFDNQEPKGLSEVAEIAFESFRKSLEKSVNNGGRGGRKKGNRLQTELKPIANRIKTDCKPNCNRFETEEEKLSLLENGKESTKEKDKGNTLVKEEGKERKKLFNNNLTASARMREGNCYEDIISHYAGGIDDETKAAIWKYIQFFQANTGCFILNEQLKTFLRNVNEYGLMFEEGVLGCLNQDGIGMAMQEMSS